jgi:hypothetical protein
MDHEQLVEYRRLMHERDRLTEAIAAAELQLGSVETAILKIADLRVGGRVQTEDGREIVIRRFDEYAIIDERLDGDRLSLVIKGSGSPITKSGQPHQRTSFAYFRKHLPALWRENAG